MTPSFTISILLKKEDNLFIAHCLELDIVTASETIEGAEEDRPVNIRDIIAMPKSPLKLRELLKRLLHFGIIPVENRGKGSEIILLKPDEPGSKRGQQYPIKNHGLGTEISIPVIMSLLRRFNIDPN